MPYLELWYEERSFAQRCARWILRIWRFIPGAVNDETLEPSPRAFKIGETLHIKRPARFNGEVNH